MTTADPGAVDPLVTNVANKRGAGLRVVLARLVDQGLWSGAFFLFNLSAAHALPVGEYAALTVATSIGVIIVACVRAYAIDGRVIGGARLSLPAQDVLSHRLLLGVSGAGALVAFAMAAGWLAIEGSAVPWFVLALAALIVLADGPHYMGTMLGRFVRVLFPASLYAVGGAIALVLAFPLGTGGGSVAALWVVALLGTILVGHLTLLRVARPGGAARVERGVPVRLAAESLYSALGSQLGILVVYLIASADDTAGIRLAYTIVFSPVFSIIQGLTPLLLRRLSHMHMEGDRKDSRLLGLWVGVGTAGVIASGVVGAVLCLTVWEGGNFASTLPYIAPVGASMLGSFILDAALLVIRFRSSPALPHRLRIWLLSGDLAIQLSLTLAFGAPGLAAGLIGGMLIKVIASIVVVLRHRSIEASKSEAL